MPLPHDCALMKSFTACVTRFSSFVVLGIDACEGVCTEATGLLSLCARCSVIHLAWAGLLLRVRAGMMLSQSGALHKISLASSAALFLHPG